MVLCVWSQMLLRMSWVLRCAGRIRTLQGTHLSRTLDMGACHKSCGTYWFLVVWWSFCFSTQFLRFSIFVSCPKPLDSVLVWSSLLQSCFRPFLFFKKKSIIWSITRWTQELPTLISLLRHIVWASGKSYWPISTIFPLVSCRLWYFTSSGAIAWRRRFSEMPSRWTPRPMRSGTPWERCCRLKAMMMPRPNASWRRWSSKLAVPWSLLPSFPESFERAPWSTNFGLTSGWGNPVYQAAW